MALLIVTEICYTVQYAVTLQPRSMLYTASRYNNRTMRLASSDDVDCEVEYWPVENDSSIARRCWTISVQVLNSSVFDRCFEFNDANSAAHVADVRADVISQVEADDLSRVVDDGVNLVITQIVEDASSLTVA